MRGGGEGGGGGGSIIFTRELTALISEATVAVVAKISKDKILAPSRFTLRRSEASTIET